MRVKMVVAGLAVVAVSVGTSVGTAEATVTKYANCTAMHVRIKGGVGKPGAVDKRKSGHAKYTPYRSTTWYTANKGLDRDHDGIACEQ